MSKSEPFSNVGHICPDCAEARKQLAAKIFPQLPLEWFVGRYCKIAFNEGGKTEHMWVLVSDFAPDAGGGAPYLIGTLNNDPVVITRVKDGDRVSFKCDEIEDVEGPRTEGNTY